jgi:hypothetical protein
VGRYAEMLDKDIMPEGYLEAPLAYDAVWATALGNFHNMRRVSNISWVDVGHFKKVAKCQKHQRGYIGQTREVVNVKNIKEVDVFFWKN